MSPDEELRRAQRASMTRIEERLALSFSQGDIEMRAKPNGTGGSAYEWDGYASVYDAPFQMYDRLSEPFMESVAPGACKRSLSNPNLDVPFVFGHSEWGIPFARTSAKTMNLSEDSHGLHVHVPAMDGRREDVRALASAVERGDVSEMSLAFVCNRQEWDASFEHRTVCEMDLHRGDVSAVVHGANPATAGVWMSQVEQLRFRRPAAIGGPVLLGEQRAQMATADINDLPDSDFAYIEPGGTKDSGGKTVPRDKRHFPIHDAAHVRNALAHAADSPFGDKAMPAIVAAAKKFGIEVSAQHSAGQPLEQLASAAESTNLSTASDYNPSYAAPSGLTCPQCGAGNHGGAKFCSQCAHSFAAGTSAGTSANVMVDAASGIPGEETQFSAARRMELRLRELEMDELAAAH